MVPIVDFGEKVFVNYTIRLQLYLSNNETMEIIIILDIDSRERGSSGLLKCFKTFES